MDGEEKFWATCWTVFVVGLVIIGLGSQRYFDHKNELMAEAIAAGADPIAVYCAFDMGNYDGALCSGVIKK